MKFSFKELRVMLKRHDAELREAEKHKEADLTRFSETLALGREPQWKVPEPPPAPEPKSKTRPAGAVFKQVEPERQPWEQDEPQPPSPDDSDDKGKVEPPRRRRK